MKTRWTEDELAAMKPEEIDRLYEIVTWYESLQASNNETFLPLFADQHRYLVLKGGGGSGKSIFAGRKVLERCVNELGHRFLVCRKVGRTLRESCFKQLLGQLSEHYSNCGYRVNRSDLSIHFDNGSEIIFSGLDDVEKLKSIYNITGIWIEEASELLEGDFNQLDIRLRGETREYKQIILSFNPISIQHWLKKRFFDQPDRRARVHESTYKDNRFLDAAAIATLEGFRETDEYYYQVYCLGMWGVTGKTVFNGKAIGKRLQELTPPEKVGLFEYTDDGRTLSGIRWLDEREGCVKLYKLPQEGVPYVIGGDTAGEGSDSFVGQVLDNRTGEQVAVLRGQFDEDVFARQIYCLGKYYNTALIGLETNFSTYPVMELERLGYPKQYVRETVDDFTHSVKRSFGFRTDLRTRPIILAELIKATREGVELLNDETTLEEMLTFVRREDTLRMEAEAGCHDDCVMALAIAQHIRPQQSYLKETTAESRKWTRSMWEDYENASQSEREYLVKKWGQPC